MHMHAEESRNVQYFLENNLAELVLGKQHSKRIEGNT